MSRIDGTGENIFVTDTHLANAHQKFVAMILELTNEGCWIIPPNSKGTPARFMVDGETDLCRRWSWRIFNGPIPAGHRIYMSCGTDHCVNPLHMYAFRAVKESGPRKVVRPKAKLNWETVNQMRQLPDPDVTILASLFDVHPTTIRAILQGKTWKRTT